MAMEYTSKYKSAIRRMLSLGWAEAIFGQNEVLNTPQVPPTVVTWGSAVGYRSRLIDPGNRS
jgi:hypothetical protein